MIGIIKKYSKCLFAILIAVLIIIASLCFLAHKRGISGISFSASQIYEMTDTDRQDAEFSSKIREEISDIFEN